MTHSEICYNQRSIFPSLETPQARSNSGIQSLHSLHITIEKANNVFQHCLACRELCLTAILSILHLSITQLSPVAAHGYKFLV
ncbi:hypothetical protein DVH24_037411 [Malus domestica]|uniref:Uncharacterized protein n=1 Tax=Malus domestica TaxID=3750 RepID=A0A498HJQ8_MALDO|nr:hypothetical protein DVH24_037411 [Malus domestica]